MQRDFHLDANQPGTNALVHKMKKILKQRGGGDRGGLTVSQHTLYYSKANLFNVAKHPTNMSIFKLRIL